VRADHFVNAAGIDCDAVRGLIAPVVESELRASKGVHLVVPRSKLQIETTVAFANKADGRLMFAIPWGDAVMVGTTDTFEDGDVRTTSAEDQRYVIDALGSAFQELGLGPDDVISSLAGVRTLVIDLDKGAANASSVSREHAVYEDPSGLISIAGGKLTTFRLMAANIVDLVATRLDDERRAALSACSTGELALGGAVEVEAKEAELRQRFELSAETAAHLVRSYGGQAAAPLEQADGDPALLRPLAAGAPYLRCEVPYLARAECPLHLEDLLTRRLRAAIWLSGQALDQSDDIAALMSTVTGWDEQARAAEVTRYRDVVARDFRPLV
jgi:glycerol-3-phosphate dehydrogenase